MSADETLREVTNQAKQRELAEQFEVFKKDRCHSRVARFTYPCSREYGHTGMHVHHTNPKIGKATFVDAYWLSA